MAERAVRCAVYTRKSTEEGLEQEFNSLDAQRDACEAYIKSQMHEGWQLLPAAFDDGGFSGGNMQRPALERLMAEVRAGRVDVIVVYKIDRLTRSLSDFAKIVDVLDNAKASFVSVTQAFNTTTSMGRLTLNVLLSFAQFEREVTGERIRDKIAASKRKGMWMGGVVPLGYRVAERKLLVVEPEAETVRHIFSEYLRVGTVPALVEALGEQDIRSKAGKPFWRGPLYHLLRNRIYLGEVTHRGDSYPGEHQRIIDDLLWARVQCQLDRRPEVLEAKPRVTIPSLLTGKLFDREGRRMSPTHASKPGRHYRYYITYDVRATDQCKPVRLPAADLEEAVVDAVVDFLNHPRQLYEALKSISAPEQLEGAIARARELGAALRATSRDAAEPVERVDVLIDRLRVEFKLRAIAPWVGDISHSIEVERRFERKRDSKLLIEPLKIAGPADEQDRTVDQGLIELMRDAHRAREALFASKKSIMQTASELGQCRTHLTQLARLSFLAPDIVTAILEGRQPKTLKRGKLLELKSLPSDWAKQRHILGFG